MLTFVNKTRDTMATGTSLILLVKYADKQIIPNVTKKSSFSPYQIILAVVRKEGILSRYVPPSTPLFFSHAEDLSMPIYLVY